MNDTDAGEGSRTGIGKRSKETMIPSCRDVRLSCPQCGALRTMRVYHTVTGRWAEIHALCCACLLTQKQCRAVEKAAIHVARVGNPALEKVFR